MTIQSLECVRQRARTQRLLPVFALLYATAALPGHAQNMAGGDEKSGQKQGAERVIITAQKRDEVLQTVPMSVTALDESTLERSGTHNLADVARLVPGLTVVSSGPGQNILIVRGIASSAGTAGTVGYYLDDTPISASSNASLLSLRGLIDPALFDLARVEVLRGPQGTLYGSSSMGGTVKYVTRQPNFEQFTGKVVGELSETNGGGWNRSANASLNIPLSEHAAAMRVDVYARDNDGFIDRYPIDPANLLGILPGSRPAARVNTDQTFGTRLALSLRLPDQWTVTPSIYFQHARLGAPFQIDVPPGSTDNLVQTRLVSEVSTQESTLANLSIRKEFEHASLVSSTSYYDRVVDVAEDSSKVLEYFFSPTPQTYVYPSVMNGEYINREITQELRLVSDFAGPWQVIGGLFYHHVDAPLHSTIPVPDGYNTAFGTTYGSFYQGGRQASVRELAEFAEASYQITPAFSARVGIRAFRVSQGFAQQGDGVFNGGPSSVIGQSFDQGYTPKFNLSWQVNGDLLLYATAAKGYRPGGPNNPAPAAVCGSEVAGLGLSSNALQKFDADTLWNYELGAKSEWLDRRVTVNASLFQIAWNKVQQQIVLQCGFNITANFGTATSKGAELEAVFRPDQHTVLHASMGYVDARLNNDVPGTKAMDGDSLLDVPHWSGALSVERSGVVFANLPGYMRMDYTYTGSANALYDRSSPFYRRAGYGLFNVRLGLDRVASDSKIGAAFFVENLFNKIGQTGLPVAISADLPTTRRIAIVRPRTVGVSLSLPF